MSGTPRRMQRPIVLFVLIAVAAVALGGWLAFRGRGDTGAASRISGFLEGDEHILTADACVSALTVPPPGMQSVALARPGAPRSERRLVPMSSAEAIEQCGEGGAHLTFYRTR